MKLREVYTSILTEKRKTKSPSLHLEHFNYIINKAIQESFNRRYQLFASTQQLSDDMISLTYDTLFTPAGSNGAYSGNYTETAVPITMGKKYGFDYIRFKLPSDYWHALGVHTTSKTTKSARCVPRGFESNSVSKRLTANAGNGVLNNAYLKPDVTRPYHSFMGGTEPQGDMIVFVGGTNKTSLTSVSLEYLKKPSIVELTKTQRDLPNDTSQEMEYSQYVCNEIIKVAVTLILENFTDPRLQTNAAINNSVQ